MPIKTSARKFEALVVQALEELPTFFKDRLQNIKALIADWPTEEELEEAGPGPDELLLRLSRAFPSLSAPAAITWCYLANKVGPTKDWYTGGSSGLQTTTHGLITGHDAGGFGGVVWHFWGEQLVADLGIFPTGGWGAFKMSRCT